MNRRERPVAAEHREGWRQSAAPVRFGPHPLSMTWRDGLFLHWPVDPDRIRPRVPDPLALDIRDGRAWVSVLPFVLADAGFRGTPAFARLTFAELNVRTYVRYRGDPGLFFFSIDVDSPLVAGLVGRSTRLPVHRTRANVVGGADRIAFSCAREGDDPGPHPARFAATYRPDGAPFYAEPDALARWLTDRRRFYAPSGRGVLTAEIAHAPWPLRPAEATIHENETFAANDLPEPTAEPIAHYCAELVMTGSIARRLDGG